MLVQQLQPEVIMVNESNAIERTSKIYDVMFYIFQKDKFNFTEIKESFKSLSYFKDSVLESYIKDFLSILDSELQHAMIDVLILDLVEAYSSLGLVSNSEWLKNFHLKHSEYSKAYAQAFVQ